MTPNPIVARCEELHREGYNVAAVTISIDGLRLRVAISRCNYASLGEEGSMSRHEISIDRTDMPAGVSLLGSGRMEDDVMSVPGNAEQAEALIVETARVGHAKDWARFLGDTADYPHFLTKPSLWRSDLPESLR